MRKNAVFFIEGLTSLKLDLMNYNYEPSRYEVDPSHLYVTKAAKVIALAELNNIRLQDPIRAGNDVDAIYEFVSQSKGNIDRKTKIFDLLVIKILSESLFQMPGKNERFIDLMQQKKNAVFLEEMYSDDTSLDNYVQYKTKISKKALFKLAENGLYNKESIPSFFNKKEDVSLSTLVQEYIDKYVDTDIEPEFGSHVIDLSQDAVKLWSDFMKFSNVLSKNKLLEYLQSDKDIKEVFLLCGFKHLPVLLDDANTPITKTEPIHFTKDIEGRNIEFHVFPDLHGTDTSYNNLIKFASSRKFKVPVGDNISKNFNKYINKVIENIKDTQFFDEYEVSFQVCGFLFDSKKLDKNYIKNIRSMDECTKKLGDVSFLKEVVCSTLSEDLLQSHDWIQDYRNLYCSHTGYYSHYEL